jgi:DNA-binding NarL/FixJ family response regulator
MASGRTPDRRQSVTLVDDHEIVAIALEHALSAVPELRYDGVTATVDELFTLMPRPQLVVLDLRLADGSSPIRNVERLVEAGAKVVAFTSGENPYMVRLAARSPILGIVRKSAPIATLIETLLRGAEGEPMMSTEWASAIESDPDLDRARLSPQEQQVLALFATGVKAVAVAAAVGIAESTVEDYVRRIRAKYARIGRPAHTKVDLYKRAIEDGFLPLPEQRNDPT